MTATSKQSPARAPAGARGRGAVVAGVAGELLITIGVVVGLFAVWQLWWTDVLAERNWEDTRAELVEEWGIDDTVGRTPPTPEPRDGRPFGLLYVPALRGDAWGVPIIEGTSYELLTGGVGHHVSTALPGAVGNMAIAGHRTSYGAPFAEIDSLRPGDQVIVETRNGWFIYELDRSVIVDAGAGWILDPEPIDPRAESRGSAVPTRPTITIYGCHPKYSAAQRYVWFGHQVDAYAKSFATPPAIQRYGRAVGRALGTGRGTSGGAPT